MKSFFYSDELNDDFAFAYIKNQREIEDNYNYINHNILFMIMEFVVYRIIMTTIAFVFSFCKGIRIKNKDVVR